MAKKALVTLRDFSLGINDKDSPNLIPDNALVDAENAIIGRGFVSKRHGYSKYTPTALSAGITKLYDMFKNNGTKEFLSVSDLKLYKDSAGTLSAIPFNTITALTSNDVQMVTYKDRNIADVVLLADGGKLKFYNGTDVKEVTPHTPVDNSATGGGNELSDPGTNDLANLTKFRAMAIKKDRIFAAAHPTVKNRISFCHHDPYIGYAVYDYWPAAFFFDIATDENDEIVDLKVFRDGLVALCKRSVWILYGDGRTINDYQLHKINVPGGCISPKSVQVVGNDLFYLSDDHVYALFATEENFVSAKIMSVNVENTLKKISRADKEKAVGYFFENKYYLSFPDGTCLVYDTLLQSWTKWSNIKANSFLERDGVLYFSADTGLIYKFDEAVYSDDGVAINFSITLKNMDFGYPVQDKKFRRLWTIAKQFDALSSSFNVTAVIDYVTVNLTDISTDQSFVLGEGVLGTSLLGFIDVVQNELRVRERGKNIQLIFTNNNVDEPLVLYGFALQYKVKRP
jgi:hypothetical protein